MAENKDILDWLIQLVTSGFIGVVASYFATKKFQKDNYENNLPKLRISEVLIHSQRKNKSKTPAIRLKLINETPQKICKLSFLLEGMTDIAGKKTEPIYHLTKIADRNDILSIPKYDADDPKAHYALQINLFNTKDILNYKRLRLSIYAECPHYNTSNVETQEYDTSNSILSKKYKFHEGNSLETILI